MVYRYTYTKLLIDSFQNDGWCMDLWIKSFREVVKVNPFGSVSNSVQENKIWNFSPGGPHMSPKLGKILGIMPKKLGGPDFTCIYFQKVLKKTFFSRIDNFSGWK